MFQSLFLLSGGSMINSTNKNMVIGIKMKPPILYDTSYRHTTIMNNPYAKIPSHQRIILPENKTQRTNQYCTNSIPNSIINIAFSPTYIYLYLFYKSSLKIPASVICNSNQTPCMPSQILFDYVWKHPIQLLLYVLSHSCNS